MFDFMLATGTITCIYALMAVGLNFQAGYGGLLNFGHIAFAGLGAYAAGIAFSMGWSPLQGLMLAIGLGVGLGAIMAVMGRKLASDYWGIATLAMAEILRTIAVNEGWLTGGANGISGIPDMFKGLQRPWNSAAFLGLSLAALGIATWASMRLSDGRFGRALRLMREEPQLAACLGYNVLSLRMKSVMTGAAMASLGGFLYAHYMSFVGPDYLVASETFLLWTMVMIGGLGNILGVLTGVVVVQFAYVLVPFAKDWLGFSSDIAGALRLGLIGLILLVCLLMRKDGLLPETLRKVG